ncbi:MAG: hypothetical protein ACREXT_09470, partial [Gammaproteobacteria bacterium]
MGTHKHNSLAHKLKRRVERMFRPKSKLMTSDEAERYRTALEEIFRAEFGLSMHPLQTSPAAIPPG